MSESYNPNTIGTPCCPSNAGIPSWQHEASETYGIGAWRCIACQPKVRQQAWEIVDGVFLK